MPGTRIWFFPSRRFCQRTYQTKESCSKHEVKRIRLNHWRRWARSEIEFLARNKLLDFMFPKVFCSLKTATDYSSLVWASYLIRSLSASQVYFRSLAIHSQTLCRSLRTTHKQRQHSVWHSLDYLNLGQEPSEWILFATGLSSQSSFAFSFDFSAVFPLPLTPLSLSYPSGCLTCYSY